MPSFPPSLSFPLAFVIGYFLGSIPFSLLFARGGARMAGPRAAAAALFLDTLKGFVAVLLGGLLAPWGAPVAGAAAWIGHVAPVWLRFRGGGGEATIAGCLLALHWPQSLPIFASWLIFEALRLFTGLPAQVSNAIWSALGEALYAGFGVLYWFYRVLFRRGSRAPFRYPQESRAEEWKRRPHEDRGAPS